MSDDFDPYRCRGVTPPGGPTMEELTLAVWKERALRAEQRAEAAEAERDRMRKQLHRALLALPPSPMCRDCADHDGTCQSDGVTPCDPYDAIPVEIARLRAGQPATSEAERIAAWIQSPRGKRDLGLQDADVVHAERYANAIRSGEWRKGQG